MNRFFNFLIEPFRKGDEHRPLLWRMKMRWSHLPNWFRKIPCMFGHWWSDWSPIKYASIGRERNCKVCGKGQAVLDGGDGDE